MYVPVGDETTRGCHEEWAIILLRGLSIACWYSRKLVISTVVRKRIGVRDPIYGECGPARQGRSAYSTIQHEALGQDNLNP
jgi:hypothetical protein